jgi:adenylate kinase family enzyme
VIQRRLVVYNNETKPILDYYPKEKIVRAEATMSQIRLLSDLVGTLVPLKESMDRERATKKG